MKKTKLSITIFSILFAFTLISNSGGRATVGGEGNTGAPGDNIKVCASCHMGGNFTPQVNIVVKDELDMMPVEQYKPGDTYLVEVNITTQIAPEAYGFQMVSLIDSDNSDVDGWSSPAANTKIASAMGRSYAEHNNPSQTSTFSVKWTAPPKESGDVSFYAAGNAVNLDGSLFGDHATVTSTTLTEDTTSPTEDISFEESTLTVYPNPTGDIVTLQFSYDFNGRFAVYSLLGTKVAEWDIEKGFGCVQIKDELPGIYIFSVFDENNVRVSTRKVVKI